MKTVKETAPEKSTSHQTLRKETLFVNKMLQSYLHARKKERKKLNTGFHLPHKSFSLPRRQEKTVQELRESLCPVKMHESVFVVYLILNIV